VERLFAGTFQQGPETLDPQRVAIALGVFAPAVANGIVLEKRQLRTCAVPVGAVVLGAGGSADFWSRVIGEPVHTGKLIVVVYVRPSLNCLAAEQGDALAQYHLAWMLSRGDGVPQNDLSAYAWASVAAAQGVSDAEVLKAWISARLTAPMVGQAQELSRKFWDHYVMPYLEYVE